MQKTWIVLGCFFNKYFTYLSIIGRGRAKYRDLSVASSVCETLRNHDILREPSSIIVLSFTYTASFYVFCVFFLQVSKTTHLSKAAAIACLQKLKAMRMLRVLFVAEQRF